MALTASNLKKVYVKSTNVAPSAGDEIVKVTDTSDPWSRDHVDTTGFSDDIYKTSMPTLIDVSLSVNGFEDMSDTPQGLLRSSLISGAKVYLTILHDGTNGFTYGAYVTGYERKGAVGEANQFTANLTMDGAPVARP
jgi:hypothetical protein